MQVLVTGADGFLGSRLVKRLEAAGHEVAAFAGDVREKENVERQVKGVDAVYHLAALLDESLPRSEMFSVNVEGTRNVVEAAAKAGVRHLVFAGTVGVYGNFDSVANEETPVKPVTAYEESKAAAEKIVLAYQEALPVTVLRLALVYGPSPWWRGIVRKVREGFPIIGDGKQRWQLVHVEDAVDALAFVLEREECFGETFIVAEGEPHSFEEIYWAIARELGLAKKPKKIPVWLGYALAGVSLLVAKLTGKETVLQPANVSRLLRNRRYDVSKMGALGWRPRKGFAEGVKEMVAALKAGGAV